MCNAHDNTDRVHPFEQAGLGRAPFRFIGASELRGPLRYPQANGTVVEVGSPGQPMGTCDYCGQGIALCCRVESADGRKFTVGSDCLSKVYAKGTRLLTDAQRAVRKIQRDNKAAKLAERRAAARGLLDANPELMTDEPHPMAWRAERGDTMRDYALFLLTCGGATGQARGCRMVEQASKVSEAERAEAAFAVVNQF